MDAPSKSRAGRRRTTIAIVLAIGVLVGAATSMVLRSPALQVRSASRIPLLMPWTPTIVEAGRSVDLHGAIWCWGGNPGCGLRRVVMHVRPAGTGVWTDVPASLVDPLSYTVTIPADLVADDGLSLWYSFGTTDGATYAYPPGGAGNAVTTETTAGLATQRLPSFSWGDLDRPDGKVLSLRYGKGPGTVGYLPPHGDGLPSAPSGFDVGPGGSIYVADRVNERVLVFSPEGRPSGSIPVEGQRSIDIAVEPDGSILTSTLGTDARVQHIDASGRVLATYRADFGVPAAVRVVAGTPQVEGQIGWWQAVAGAGGDPLTATQEAAAMTAGIAGPSGGSIRCEALGETGFAVSWTDASGEKTGADVSLPKGVRPGPDYLAHPLTDGGLLLVGSLYDDRHDQVGLFRFDRNGRLVSERYIPGVAFVMDAQYTLVRWRDPAEILVAHDHPHGIRIDSYEVAS